MSETCDQCGQKYETIYGVPNEVWARIAPKPETLGKHIEHQYGGMLCIPCAERRARETGIVLYWNASENDWAGNKSWVHLAGTPVTLGDRVIQRCFICGMKLCDNLGAMAPVGPNGEAPAFPTFGVGDWIEVTPGNPTVYRSVGKTESPQITEGDVPENCCLEMVE